MEIEKWYKKTSGQAFKIDRYDGLTIRDYFAAAALQGILASGFDYTKSTTIMAYEYADQMIAERDK